MALSVSQELVLWGKRGNRVRAAESALREAEAQIAGRERSLAADIRRRYLEYLLAVEKVRVADQAVEPAKGLRESAEVRLREGDIPEYELNLAKAEEAEVGSRKRAAQIERDSARRGLLLAAGIAGDPPLVEESWEEAPLVASPEEAAASAVASRPELLAARATRERREAESLAAGREHLPNLTAGLSLQRETSAVEVEGRTFKTTDYLLGLKLSMPIPVFDRNAAGVLEASARLRGAEERLRLATERVAREGAGSYREWESVRKGLELYDEQVLPPLRENVGVMHEAYRLGEIGIIPVIQEQRKLLQAMENRLLLLQSLGEARSRLEYAAGLPIDGGIK